MGLEVMKRCGECPPDFGDQLSSLLHRLFTCDNSVHVIGNLERPDIDQVSKTHLLRLSYQRFSKECELSNIAGWDCQPLRIVSCGGDLSYLSGICAAAAHREPRG